MLSHRSIGPSRPAILFRTITYVLAGGALFLSVPALASLTIDGSPTVRKPIPVVVQQVQQSNPQVSPNLPTEYKTIYVPVGSSGSSSQGYVAPKELVAPLPTPLFIPSADGSSSFIPFWYSQVISETGMRPARIAASQSVREEPLREAITSIIPSSFELNDNGVLSQATINSVSAFGPRPWPFVLADVVRSAHLVANIDWGRRQVSLAPAPSKNTHHERAFSSHVRPNMTVSSEAAPIPAAGAPLQHFAPVTQPINIQPINIQPIDQTSQVNVLQSWPMSSSLSLKENVQNWAKQAGFTLVWTGSDYPVVGSPVFHGSFGAPDGPIATIIRGYANSKQPLVANLTMMDNVLYVHNKYAERSVVPDAGPSDLAPQLYDAGSAPTTSPFGDNVSGQDPKFTPSQSSSNHRH